VSWAWAAENATIMPPAQISRTDRDNTVSTIMSIFPGKTCKADVARSDVIGLPPRLAAAIFYYLAIKTFPRRQCQRIKS
jgi:hypothetical protein